LEDSLPFYFTLAKSEFLCKISLLRLGCPPHPRRSIFIYSLGLDRYLLCLLYQSTNIS
jgi:hypothetical protein